MGKGDKKTKRGKILMGSHGVRRPRRKLARILPLMTMKEEIQAEAVKEVAVKEKATAKPKAVKEDVHVEAPIVAVSADEAAKPARKKAPPKGSAKKEVT
jgi:30S ribosomal protein S31